MPTVPDPADSHSGPDDPAPGAQRQFTVAEANGLLPFLRSALADAQGHLEQMRTLGDEIRRMEAVGRMPDGAWILGTDRRVAAGGFAEHQAACERLLQQVSEHGCQVKDLEVGLCDFPAVVDGVPALLCWRMDEPAVAYYHDYLDGYRGRKPIPPGTP